MGNAIGEGNFAKVRLANHTLTGEKVCFRVCVSCCVVGWEEMSGEMVEGSGIRVMTERAPCLLAAPSMDVCLYALHVARLHDGERHIR